MKYIGYVLLILLFCSFEPVKGLVKVIGIKDGDTIVVLNDKKEQTTIRLIDIDAPEKKQDFGMKSKQYLSDLIYGKMVKIEGEKLDRNKRQLSTIYLGAQNVNLELVKAGMAYKYKYSKNEAIEKAEQKAKQNKVGVWSMPNAMNPYYYRHKDKVPTNE